MNKEIIIVALDVSTAREAREIVNELRDEVGAFKIGLQLFTSTGASFVRELTEAGIKIFLDVKFHDIPNTVAKASLEVVKLGIWMFNLHALGGAEMLSITVREVKEFCDRENLTMPKILGVTILTSSDEKTLNEIGVKNDIKYQVLNLAKISAICGLDGVVASPQEADFIRQKFSKEDLLIVTPGIRPVSSDNFDQKRIATPSAAIRSGADYLVIGRPITKAENRKNAVEEIIEELVSVKTNEN